MVERAQNGQEGGLKSFFLKIFEVFRAQVGRSAPTGPDVKAFGLDSVALGRSISHALQIKGGTCLFGNTISRRRLLRHRS